MYDKNVFVSRFHKHANEVAGRHRRRNRDGKGSDRVASTREVFANRRYYHKVQRSVCQKNALRHVFAFVERAIRWGQLFPNVQGAFGTTFELQVVPDIQGP